MGGNEIIICHADYRLRLECQSILGSHVLSHYNTPLPDCEASAVTSPVKCTLTNCPEISLRSLTCKGKELTCCANTATAAKKNKLQIEIILLFPFEDVIPDQYGNLQFIESCNSCCTDIIANIFCNTINADAGK